MVKNSDMPVSSNYFLKPGYIVIANKPTVISTVLGSCVSVCLYDRKRSAGGMNHFQLPSIGKSEDATARYGNVATLALIAAALFWSHPFLPADPMKAFLAWTMPTQKSANPPAVVHAPGQNGGPAKETVTGGIKESSEGPRR